MPDIDIILKGTDNASGKIKDVNSELGKLDGHSTGLAGGLGTLSNMIGNTLKVAAVAATAALVALGAGLKNSITAAAGMEQGVADISAIMGKSAPPVEELNKLIQDLGLDPKLKVSATEAAAAINMLAKNGVSWDDIQGGMARNTILLANATNDDFALAADVATNAMVQFNKDGSDMEGVINGIIGVTQSSQFDINDYALAIAQAGGVAGSVGVDFEDFNAMLSATSSSFGSGSDAGTSFKVFLQQLIPDTNKSADAMRALGLFSGLTGTEFTKLKGEISDTEQDIAALDPTSKNYSTRLSELNKKLGEQRAELMKGGSAFFDANGNMKSGEEIAAALATAFDGLSDAERISAASTIFGTDAMRTALALADQGAGTVAALKAEIGDTSAEDAAATRMDTLKGSWEIFLGVVETLNIQLGTAFLPIVREVVDWLTKMAIEHGPKVIEWATKFATAVSYLWERLGFLTRTFEDGTTVLGEFLKQLGVSETTANAIGTAFTTVAGAVLYLWERMGFLTRTFEDGTTVIGEFLQKLGVSETTANAVGTAIVTVWNALSSLVTIISDAIAPFVEWNDLWIALGLVLGTVVISAIASFVAAIAPVVALIAGLTIAIALLRTAWETDWGGIKTATLEALGSITTRFAPLVEAIKTFGADALTEIGLFVTGNETEFTALGKIWDATKTAFGGFFTDLGNTVATAAAPVLDWFATTFPGATAALKKAWEDVSKRFGEIWVEIQKLFTTGSGEVGKILEEMQKWWQEHGDEVMKIVDNFLTLVITVIGTQLTVIANTIKMALQLLNGDWKGAWETLKDTVKVVLAALNVIHELFMGNLKEAWKLGLGDILSNAKTKWEEIKTTISEKIASILTSITTKWEEIKQAIIDKVDSILISIKSKWEEIKKAVVDKASEILTSVTAKWEEIKTAVANKITDIVTNITTKWESIKTTIATKITEILSNVNDKWESIKKAVVDKTTEIVTNVTTKWNEIKTVITTKITEIVTNVTTKWEEIKTTITNKITEIVTNVTTKWNEIKTTIVTKITEIATSLTTKWEEIKTTIANKITEIVTNLTTKWAEIKTIITNKIEEIKATITTKWDEIKAAITTKITEILTAVTTKWEEIKTAITTKITEIVTAVTTKWEEIKTAATTKWDEVKTSISTKMAEIVTTVTSKAGEIATGFITGIGDFVTKVTAKFTEVKTAVIASFSDAGTWLSTAGGNVVQGFIDGIGAKIGEAQTKVTELATLAATAATAALGIDSPSKVFVKIGQNAGQGFIDGMASMFGVTKKKGDELGNIVPDTLRKLLGINSPSSELKTLGKQTVEGFEDGIVGNTKLALTAATDLTAQFIKKFDVILSQLPAIAKDSMSEFVRMFRTGMDAALGLAANSAVSFIQKFDSILDKLPKVAKDSMQQFGQLMQTGTQTVLSNTQGFVTSLLGMFSQMAGDAKQRFTALVDGAKTALNPSTFTALGSQAVQGFVNGLNSMIGAAQAKVTELANIASQALATTLEAQSPSRRFHRYGEWAGQGFINGMNAKLGEARAKAAELAQVAMTAAQTVTQMASNTAGTVKAQQSSTLYTVPTAMSAPATSSQFTWIPTLTEALKNILSSGAKPGPTTTLPTQLMNDDLMQRLVSLFGSIRNSTKPGYSFTAAEAAQGFADIINKVVPMGNWNTWFETMKQKMGEGAATVALRGAETIYQVVRGLSTAGNLSYISGITNPLQTAAQSLTQLVSNVRDFTNNPAFTTGNTSPGDLKFPTAFSTLMDNIQYMVATGDFPGKSANLPYYEDSRLMDLVLDFSQAIRKFGNDTSAASQGLTDIITGKLPIGSWDTWFKAMKLQLGDAGAQIGLQLGKNIFDYAKISLGIHSPSSKFAWLGEMSGQGFVQGFAHGMTNLAIPNPSGGMGGSGSAGSTNNTTNFNVNVTSTGDAVRDIRNQVELYALTFGAT